MPKEKTMPVGTEAKKLNDLPMGEATTTLLYGDSRSGKTYLIGTCGSRMVYIYFTVGEGIDTLKSPGFRKRFPDCNPIVVPISESDQVKAFDAVKQVIDYMVDNRRDEFDFIAVDEATAFKRHAMWKGLEISDVEGRMMLGQLWKWLFSWRHNGTPKKKYDDVLRSGAVLVLVAVLALDGTKARSRPRAQRAGGPGKPRALTRKQEREVRARHRDEGCTYGELGRYYAVSRQTIMRIVTRRRIRR